MKEPSGTLDVTIPSLLFHNKGLYKALLTASCKQDTLPCEPDGFVFTEPSKGKILTGEWDITKTMYVFFLRIDIVDWILCPFFR